MVGMRGHRAYRLDLARREAPKSLGWTAALILLLSVLNVLLGGHGFHAADAVHLIVVLLFAAMSLLVQRDIFARSAVPWVVAGCALVLVLSLEWEVWVDPTPLGVAYVLLVMLAFSPFTLDPRAVALAQLPMVIGFVLAVSRLDAGDPMGWLIAGVAALLMGAVILRVRLNGIDELADLSDRSRAEATRDPLTHALNRRGIEERIPELVALALRREEGVFAMFVDVDGLKAANDRRGHEFGDEVIVAVADAIRLTIRAEDLLGRWGGDEFIVVGMGRPLPPGELAARLRTRLTHSGIDPRHWPGTVSIGAAVERPGGLDFDRLVASADADMYARRRAQREA